MMIQYFGLKESLLKDLLKSFKLHKDRSHLVQVERTVTKKGKTFIQKFWVKPDEVKKTDIVIGGHKNLDPSHPSHKHGTDLSKPAEKVSPIVKAKCMEFYKKFSTDGDFLEAMEQLGISWKPSSNPNSNVFRARLKLSQHMQSGYDVDSAYKKIRDHTQDQRKNMLDSSVNTSVDFDKIEIPENATEAQKNLINIINGLTNLKDIKKGLSKTHDKPFFCE